MDSSDENYDGLEENEEMIEAEELFEDDKHESEMGDNVKLAKGDVSEDEKLKPKQTTKKIVKNPRVILNFERLKGPNGFDALSENFKEFKFKGKHFEKEDLAAVMKTMQHWMCHHLYPGYDVETCMKALEKLGRKRVIQTHMRRMRQDAKSINWENKENVSENDLDCRPSYCKDDFDKLLREEPLENVNETRFSVDI